ncbi:unnamed protein product [Eretmochelys imbricata]
MEHPKRGKASLGVRLERASPANPQHSKIMEPGPPNPLRLVKTNEFLENNKLGVLSRCLLGFETLGFPNHMASEAGIEGKKTNMCEVMPRSKIVWSYCFQG